MKITKIPKKIIDILQWVLIAVVFGLLVTQGLKYNEAKRQLVTEEEYNKENTYVRIYQSQEISKLKKQNRELYDSITKLQDVESGMIIKFVERYKTDTIKVDKFIVKHDTIPYIENGVPQMDIDTLYHYAQDNDTVKINIDVNATNLKWVTADLELHDKFIIINREKDGVNQTIIHHGDNTDIEGTTMWHRKDNRKWYQKFTVSPQVGVGYGLTHKNIDIYAGFGFGYSF